MEIVTEQMIYLPGLFFFSFLIQWFVTWTWKRERKRIETEGKRFTVWKTPTIFPFDWSESGSFIMFKIYVGSCLGPIEKHSTNSHSHTLRWKCSIFPFRKASLFIPVFIHSKDEYGAHCAHTAYSIQTQDCWKRVLYSKTCLVQSQPHVLCKQFNQFSDTYVWIAEYVDGEQYSHVAVRTTSFPSICRSNFHSFSACNSFFFSNFEMYTNPKATHRLWASVWLYA